MIKELLKEPDSESVQVSFQRLFHCHLAQDELTLGQGEAIGAKLSSPPPVTFCPDVVTANPFGNGWWK